MVVRRREFLLFLGAIAGSNVANFGLKEHSAMAQIVSDSNATSIAAGKNIGFQPVKLPLPLDIEEMTSAEQISAYSNYEVRDDLVLPEGFTYDVIAAWGDRVGDSRFGYNNDYLSFIETAPDEGLLTVNFEYISGKTWMETYAAVIGQQLPLAAVKEKFMDNQGEIDAFSLGQDNPLKTQIIEISREGLIDQGIGVIAIKRNPNGKWERTSRSDLWWAISR